MRKIVITLETNTDAGIGEIKRDIECELRNTTHSYDLIDISDDGKCGIYKWGKSEEESV